MTENRPEGTKVQAKPGQPAQPAQPSQPQPQSGGGQSGLEAVPQHFPERGEKLRSRVEEEISQPTSASLLQEFRVPGVQYPASSNQLPEDWEEQETVVQKAEREQAEAIAKLDEGSADLISAAGQSGDARLQQLLANRDIAVQNQDEVGIKSVDAKLAQVLNA